MPADLGGVGAAEPPQEGVQLGRGHRPAGGGDTHERSWWSHRGGGGDGDTVNSEAAAGRSVNGEFWAVNCYLSVTNSS